MYIKHLTSCVNISSKIQKIQKILFENQTKSKMVQNPMLINFIISLFLTGTTKSWI